MNSSNPTLESTAAKEEPSLTSREQRREEISAYLAELKRKLTGGSYGPKDRMTSSAIEYPQPADPFDRQEVGYVRTL